MGLSARELAALIGRRGRVVISGARDVSGGVLILNGHITDVHQAYGNIRFTVSIDGQTAVIRVNEDSFKLEGTK